CARNPITFSKYVHYFDYW
nr:immunoglobulin heavy chain junction region [Macaca mulatta]